MTIKEYKRMLRQRRNDLKAEIIVDAHERKFIESHDTRYVERRLINQILRLLRLEE